MSSSDMKAWMLSVWQSVGWGVWGTRHRVRWFRCVHVWVGFCSVLKDSQDMGKDWKGEKISPWKTENVADLIVYVAFVFAF